MAAGPPSARREPAARLDTCDLGAVAGVAAGCDLCRLAHTRTQVVFGHGAADAKVMFVAEAPGYHEDRQGALVVGPAAELFDSLLADSGLSRDEVYLTTVVKCRPPRNRTPFPDEIESCESYLFRQVTLVQPDVICALGNVAIRLLTGKPHRLSDVHGQVFDVVVQGRPLAVVPLFHPAAVLHDPDLQSRLRSDMGTVRRLLLGERPEPAVEPEAGARVGVPAAASGGQEQLTLNIG